MALLNIKHQTHSEGEHLEGEMQRPYWNQRVFKQNDVAWNPHSAFNYQVLALLLDSI